MVHLIVLDIYTPHVYCHSTYIVFFNYMPFEELGPTLYTVYMRQAYIANDDVAVDSTLAGQCVSLSKWAFHRKITKRPLPSLPRLPLLLLH